MSDYGSIKVIGNGTVRYVLHDFLLALLMQTFLPPRLGVTALEFHRDFCVRKLEAIDYSMSEEDRQQIGEG